VRAYSQGYGKEILDGLQREWILEDAISWSDRVACLVHPTMTSGYYDQVICRVCHLPDRCISGVELLDSKHSRFPTWSWLSTAWGIGRGPDQDVVFSRGSVYELSPSEPRYRLLSVVDNKNRPTRLHLAGLVLIPTRLRAVVDRYYRDVDPSPLVHECPARGDGIVFIDKTYGPCYGSKSPRCDPSSIFASLSPPASALFMGLASF